ncbi:pentapeptide repeat-containing protein [Chitinophaga barathri]|uniref:Pentapeptide repeat-containing protein n=1 Tax=Chitinophaga barathri TaxID=1647451 RepID=A0A3N4ME00_9BACT|nr:pentapeptide repeat-containing protein [Chitinophaga barathri]RPD42124.1 pentapeptide repeat-containing protein [Chitinophaga barathri]
MEELYNETFTKKDYTQNPLPKGEYEQCTFDGCNFSEADLTGCVFLECEFKGCNLSLAKLSNTAFREVTFKDCKMLGLRFDQCSKFLFQLSTDNCNCNSASFFQTKLTKTSFKNTQFQEADFSECDLSSTLFDHCDFSNATFDHTTLEKADLRTSFNYSLDPERNRIQQARFSLYGLPGLLGKYNIEVDEPGS